MGRWRTFSRRNSKPRQAWRREARVQVTDPQMKEVANAPRAASHELGANFAPIGGARFLARSSKLVACCFFLIASGVYPLSAQDREGTLKVDVKLVNVFVTVTDARGAPVPNLQKENFTLKEDGREQKIAVFAKESALPLSIVLAVDTSLSTRKDLPLELISERKFAQAILRPQDGLAVFQFSEIVNEVLPFTADVKTIDRAIDKMRL